MNDNNVKYSYGEGSFTQTYLDYVKNHPELRENIPQEPKDKKPRLDISLLGVITVIVIVAINLYCSPVLWALAGNKDIYKKSEGTYCYNVVVENDDYGPYTLPAEIYKTDGNYYIQRAYWPNGGYMSLEDEVYVDEPVTVTDQEERDWKLILLNVKSQHPKITETNVLNDRRVMAEFWLWNIAPIVILIIHTIIINSDRLKRKRK